MQPIRNSEVAVLERSRVAAQWTDSGPFVVGPSWRKPEYATTVLHELGADVAYLVLQGFDEIKPGLIDALMRRGVLINGRVLHLAFITQRKGVHAPLPLVDEATAARAHAMFPRVVDVVRMGALLTPMRGGVAREVMAKVAIVDPHDERFQLGDGQGVVRADWMPKQLPVRQKVQFRAVLHGIRDGVDALAKGTLLRVPDADMHGLDLVLTKNEVKGGLSALPLGVYDVPVTIGVMQGESERMSGRTTFGRQFAQNLPEEYFTNPETVEFVNASGRSLRKLADHPTRLARFLAEQDGMRDEDGDVDRRQLLAFAAALSDQIGNNQLMFTSLIRKLLSEALADRCRNLAVSGGVDARYYMFGCDNSLPDGVIALSKKAFFRWHGARREAVAGRNPHVEFKGAAAVTLIWRNDVEDDYAFANERTLVDSAADFDGDAILISTGNAPQIRLWRELLSKVDRSNVEKVRQQGEPPASKAEMIARSLNINIGRIERTMANFVAAEHVFGPKAKGTIAGKSVHVDIPTIKAALAVEIQKAVDGIKTGSTPNMQVVDGLMELSLQLVTSKDVGYIPLDNGKLPIFRCAPMKLTSAMEDFGVEPGEYVLPGNYVSEATPLGRHMHRVQNEVPWVELDAIPNASFDGWLEFLPGEGAIAARKSTAELNAAIQQAHSLPEYEQADVVSEALRAFREEWRGHFAAKNATWLRSAASQFWSEWVSGDSNGYALWHGIPEVWGAMLLERKAVLSQQKPITTGRIIGNDFAVVMGGKAELWVDGTVYVKQTPKGPKKRIRIGKADNLLEACNAEPGKYTLRVRTTSTSGRHTACFYEQGYVVPDVKPAVRAAEAAQDALAPFVVPQEDDDEMADLAALAADDYIEEEVVFE